MSRRAMYRAVKSAFFYLDCYLLLLIVFGLLALFQTGRPLTPIVTVCACNVGISLWAKRAVIGDLIAGQTKVFHGEIVCRQIAGSLKWAHVEYLVEKAEGSPRKFVLFSEQFPFPIKKGLLSGPATFQYLPRSRIILKIEQAEPAAPGKQPRHRTKNWYQAKKQAEEELRQLVSPDWCKFQHSFWFWEQLPVLLWIALFGFCLVCKGYSLIR